MLSTLYNMKIYHTQSVSCMPNIKERMSSSEHQQLIEQAQIGQHLTFYFYMLYILKA